MLSLVRKSKVNAVAPIYRKVISPAPLTVEKSDKTFELLSLLVAMIYRMDSVIAPEIILITTLEVKKAIG